MRASLLPFLVVLPLAACSSKETHPPPGGGCGPTIDCTGAIYVPGPSGGVTGTDAGVTDAGDAGIPTITVSGTINTATFFTADPATTPVNSGETGLTVSATQNGTVVSTTVTAGSYTLTDVDAYIWPYFTSFGLSGRNSVTGGTGLRTLLLERVNAGTTTISPLAIPSFDATLIAAANNAYGIPSTATTSTGTIVLQILDSSGTPVSGITAINPYIPTGTATTNNCPTTPTSSGQNCGPYYDSGNDGIEQGVQTKARGTIVFLAVVPGTFTTRLTYPDGITLSGLQVPVSNQAVTFFRGSLR